MYKFIVENLSSLFLKTYRYVHSICSGIEARSPDFPRILFLETTLLSVPINSAGKENSIDVIYSLVYARLLYH